MRLAPANDPYLSGTAFSTLYDVVLEHEEEDFRITERQDVLLDLSRGKRVIHAGCVDHSIETIEEKLRMGMWLHSNLAAVASRCLGVDTNGSGIEHVRTALGYSDVVTADISNGLPEPYAAESWDFLLLPEVLEHIDNPVDFLTRIHTKFRSSTGALVVTVPNAFALGNFRRARAGRECINSDHRYWFTPFTIAKVLTRAGFRIQDLRLCVYGPLRYPVAIRRWCYRRWPLMRHSIVVLASYT